MFKKGDLVIRRYDDREDFFWNIRSVKELNGIGGVYKVEEVQEGNTLRLEKLRAGFDARKFHLATTKKLEDWM